jgi:hypothetical protein
MTPWLPIVLVGLVAGAVLLGLLVGRMSAALLARARRKDAAKARKLRDWGQ